MHRRRWVPWVGWVIVVALLAAFLWGLNHRARLEATGEQAVNMLFVPSVEQGEDGFFLLTLQFFRNMGLEQ